MHDNSNKSLSNEILRLVYSFRNLQFRVTVELTFLYFPYKYYTACYCQTFSDRKAINRKWEAVYKADAKFQMSRLKAGSHPMRKVLHMHSFYPETIRRLEGKIATKSRRSGGGITAHHLRGGYGRDDVRLPPHQPPQQAAK